MLQAGDTIVDTFLGRGEVLDPDGKAAGMSDLVLVRWEKDPPLGYDLGGNPCWVFEKYLKKEERCDS